MSDELDQKIRTVREQISSLQAPSCNGGGKKTPAYKLMSEIEPQPVEWLWKPRIALGEITVVDGDPGTNKSSFTMDMAARVSTGKSMPDTSETVQGGVLLLAAEDSIRKTLPLRLIAAGANMTKVAVFEEAISLPGDMATLREAVFKLGAKLVVCDPFSAFLGGNACSDQSVRQALMPLKNLAEQSNAAVVMVRHLTKSGGKHALYRALGSIGIVAAVRSALLVAKDPQDENLRVMCHYKNNLGPLASSLLFEPVAEGGAVKIEWRGECDYKPEDLLGTKSGDKKRVAAQKFLVDCLANGPVEQAILKAKAQSGGFAWRTVERAREDLGIRSRRRGWGPGSKWLWTLNVDDEGTVALDANAGNGVL